MRDSHDRSRSPRRDHDAHADRRARHHHDDDERRSGTPERRHRRRLDERHLKSSEETSSRHSSRRHRSHKHDRPSASSADAAAVSVSLPFSARPLSKADLPIFEALFADYLDLQKQIKLEDLDEREVKGRWKSFVSKWNRGELAEGWYDPEMFSRIAARGPPPPRSLSPPSTSLEKDPPQRAQNSEDDEDYGPLLPQSEPSGRRAGAKAPTREDLSIRNELNSEEREATRVAERNALRAARKADHVQQKERLDELVPRAEAGTRERQLEKRALVNEKMRAFREKSPGGDDGAAGNEAEVMGTGDSLEEYKRMKANEQRRKTEREIRREEIERAKREEIEERRRVYQEKEDGTVAMLRELAKQRFG